MNKSGLLLQAEYLKCGNYDEKKAKIVAANILAAITAGQITPEGLGLSIEALHKFVSFENSNESKKNPKINNCQESNPEWKIWVKQKFKHLKPEHFFIVSEFFMLYFAVKEGDDLSESFLLDKFSELISLMATQIITVNDLAPYFKFNDYQILMEKLQNLHKSP